jgi:RHS repeat-associated protein
LSGKERSAAPLGGGTVTYYYDAQGQRVQKANGNSYVYGLQGEVLAEYDSAMHLVSEYVYLGGRRVARRDASSGLVYYYYADHLGTARVMTDATGHTQQESDYEPFGVERPLTNLVANKYKFTGKERDSESGNDHFWARNYTSTLGRWLTPDPGAPDLFDPQSLNRYAYALNNPTRFVDSSGRFAKEYHIQLTTAGFEREGYSGDVARQIAYYNTKVDKYLNDEGHALLHSQTPSGETREQAQAEDSAIEENALEGAAAAVLEGQNDYADQLLGIASHDIQDEKHEFIEFEKHTGNPLNDCKTKEGCFQLYTDAYPNQKQLDAAADRTLAIIKRFEAKIRQLGQQEGLTEGQVEQILSNFKQRRFPVNHCGQEGGICPASDSPFTFSPSGPPDVR